MTQNKTDLFVKFCSLNTTLDNEDNQHIYTLENLEENKIKLSTVYQLDDLNEFRPLSINASLSSKPLAQEWKQEIIATAYWINDLNENNKHNIRKTFIHYPGLEPQSERFFTFCLTIYEKNEIIDSFIQNPSAKTGKTSNHSFLQHLCEIAIWRRIRIYCSSPIDIFTEKGNAHHMFSLYAGNYSGVALIYDRLNAKENHPIKIKYPTEFTTQMEDMNEIIHPNKSITFFKKSLAKKDPIWSYQNEVRFITIDDGKQSIATIPPENLGLSLKAIVHTNLIYKDHLSTIHTINEKTYQNKLAIIEAWPSAANRNTFRVLEHDTKNPCKQTELYDYLQKVNITYEDY